MLDSVEPTFRALQDSLWPKNKPEYEQVSTLLYAMGDCADDILATLRLDETKATYKATVAAVQMLTVYHVNLALFRSTSCRLLNGLNQSFFEFGVTWFRGNINNRRVGIS